MSDPELKIGGLTVRIERASCIGSGNCVNLAPSLFQLDDEKVASFRPGPISDRDTALEACRICPVDALLVFDERGEQVVP